MGYQDAPLSSERFRPITFVPRLVDAPLSSERFRPITFVPRAPPWYEYLMINVKET